MHGENLFLLLQQQNWSYALDIDAEQSFTERPTPQLPLGQGMWATGLVPVSITVVGHLLDHSCWGALNKGREGGRWMDGRCHNGTTSVPAYTSVTANIPPSSPVRCRSGPKHKLTLLPYGATDLTCALPSFPSSLPRKQMTLP